MSEGVKVGIVGASGYTGAELMRLLWGHPGASVEVFTANKYAGKSVGSLYPSLGPYYEGSYTEYDPAALEGCDVVFLGLPHGKSMKVAPELLEAGFKVIDMSADFRLGGIEEYELWYGISHECPELLTEAAYGLPEIYRAEIAGARLVANPGCYPTATLLGLYPAARAGLINGTVVVDAKSGVSGAGRGLTLQTHFPQVADGMAPYAVSGHRHLPEVKGGLAGLAQDPEPKVVFTPHLAPMNRGILCTIYVPLADDAEPSEVRGVYESTYAGEEFVHLLPEGRYPDTKSVQGGNDCHVALEFPGSDMLIVMTVIDNLVKGASGQAVQNMNILCGLPEGTGLAGPAVFP
ncbi:MAG: N-acetyl-gamma-glutamyl-phosphate reductase [Actinomycetota bacterium]